MKKNRILFAALMTLTVFTGCQSNTTTVLDDPNDPTRVAPVREKNKVSQDECSRIARSAAKSALNSPQFNRFLNKYRQEKNDPLSVPLMQISTLVNDTSDPTLNMALITNELFETLLNADTVEVTYATGAEARSSAADARDLAHDNNFKKSTVIKRGTLEAPRLSLEGRVVTNTVTQDRTTRQTQSFNLTLIDLETGKVIWTFNGNLGVDYTKSYFGS